MLQIGKKLQEPEACRYRWISGLRIGLNATCLNSRPSGAKQRFIGLYSEVFKICPEYEFFIYEPADCDMQEWFPGAENVVFRHTPIPSRGRLSKYVRGSLFWPPTIRRDRLDLLESFHLPLHGSKACLNVLTLHDIRGLDFEQNVFTSTLFRLALNHSINRADLVIAVSATMRKAVLSYFPEKPVSVIQNGIDVKEFSRISLDEVERVRDALNLPPRYVLSVGHFERRKNYLNLIEAMAHLRSEGHPIPLILVGNDSGELQTVQERIVELQLADSVHILSGISDDQIRCLYRGCELFVFPSLYEGFGIPVLEAMAAQRPIVLSNLPVFKEITEEKGSFFEPLDPKSIAASMLSVLTSEEKQQKLIESGRRLTEHYAYSHIAPGLAEIYRSKH